VLYLREALGFVRLFRSGRTNVRLEWRTRTPDSPALRLEPDEAAAPPDTTERPTFVSDGWGFDRREWGSSR
jgi:hypothetical protein